MPRFKVVVVEHGYNTLQPERDVIESAGGELIDAESFSEADRVAACGEADGIMVRRATMTRESIGRFHRCKILLRYGVGVDNIDLPAATEAGIIVGHVPVYCQDEVSAHAIALLLACIRQIVQTHKKVERGGWDVHRESFVFRMAGKTLGLIGLGTLGQAVARKLQGWDLRLIAFDPYIDNAIARKLNVKLESLQVVLQESDYISLHVPLLPETFHLINPETLRKMKRGSILVNTARGPVVDANAVLQSLESGHLAGASLDVFEEEPPAVDSPVRQHPGLVVTDHMAWYSEESQIQLQRTAAEEVARACTGGLPNAIANPEVLERLGRVNDWTPNHLACWQRKRADMLGR